MLTLDKQEVEFNELVPEKSSKHIAAVAFVRYAFPHSPHNADLRPFSMIALVCLLPFWRYLWSPTNSDTALATKKILTINQPEPWEDINIQFAVKNPWTSH